MADSVEHALKIERDAMRSRLGEAEADLRDVKGILWRVIQGAPLGHHMMGSDEEWHALLREARDAVRK